jgi:hypothetical protein
MFIKVKMQDGWLKEIGQLPRAFLGLGPKFDVNLFKAAI